MNGTVSDAIGIGLATLVAVPVVVLPGYALGAATGAIGFREATPGRRALTAVLIGLALLPWIDSMAVRVAGVPAAAAVNLALAVPGLACALKGRRAWRPDGLVVIVGALWLATVVYAMADLDLAGALYQPFLVIDLVKHAATTRAIVETGAPPQDPFFARDTRVSYYYFFYTLAALVDWLGRGWVNGRTAFAGLAVWTGVGLVGLLDQLLARSGLVRALPPRRVRAILLALLPAGGLEVLLVAKMRFVTGHWLPKPEWVNEPVTWWLASLVWVPDHVTGLLAAWLGWLALVRVNRPGERDPPAPVTAILVAGVAFAACLGLSVWVCLGAVVTTALWLAILAAGRRWRDAAHLAAAGLLAGALGAVQLRDMLANRAETGAAVALAIRQFGPIEDLLPEPWMSAARLVLLPINYYLSFGVFASGALLFWRLVPRHEILGGEVGRLLALSAGVALTLGGVLRSVLINNDLGWRVVLFGQVSAFVWTVVAVARISETRGSRRTLAALWLIGCATTLYGLVELRVFRTSGDPGAKFINARPEIDRALRDAYGWAAVNLPADLVLQHDPRPPRVFAFGLYGRQPVGVADQDAKLFGASDEAVSRRILLLLPVFAGALDDVDLRRRVAEAGIGALVVSAQDPVWQDRASWVWRAPAAYASPVVRIIRAADL